MPEFKWLEIIIATLILIAFIFTDFNNMLSQEPLGRLVSVILKAFVVIVVYDILKSISDFLSVTQNKYLNNSYKVCKFLGVLIILLIEILLIVSGASYLLNKEPSTAIKLFIVSILFGIAVFKILIKEYQEIFFKFFRKKK